MARVGSLSTSLTLESVAFLEGVKKVRSSVDQLDRSVSGKLNKIQQSAASMGSAFKATVAGLAIGFATDGLQTAINQGLEYASSLGEVAQQLGVTTRTLQEYRYAATQTGISQEQLDAGLGRLTRSLGMAEAGNKPLIAAFKELNVTARSTDQALPQIVAGLSKIEDPAKRAALEVTLFGKAGQKLDTLLAGGIGQVDELRNAAHRLGIVLSDEAISKADETADKLAAVQTVLKARISGVVADNSDAILVLANSLATLAANAIDAGAQIVTFYSRVGARFKSGQPLFPAMMGAWADQERDDRNAGLGSRRVSTPWGNAANSSIAAWGRRQNSGGTLDLSGGGGGGGRKRRAGGGGGRKGRDPADDLRSVIDSALPDEAQRREIEAKLAKLGSDLAKKLFPADQIARAREKLTAELNAIGDNGQALLDRIIPEDAEKRNLEADLAEVDRRLAAQIGNPGRWAEARSRIVNKLSEIRQEAADVADANSGSFLGLSKSGFDGWMSGFGGLVEDTKAKNREVRDSFSETARDISNSFSSLVSSLRGGGILGKLSGLLDFGISLGSAGLFGSKFQTRMQSRFDPIGPFAVGGGFGGGLDGRRARGGPVLPNRQYLVGERGPELLRMGGRGGSIIPNNQLGGPIELHIIGEEGPLFRPVVRSEAAGVTVSYASAAGRTQTLRGRQRYA